MSLGRQNASSGTNSVCKDLEVGHELGTGRYKMADSAWKPLKWNFAYKRVGQGTSSVFAEMHNLLPWQIEWNWMNCIICLPPWQILPAESLCVHIIFSLRTSSSECIPQDVPNNTTLYPISFAQNWTLTMSVGGPKGRHLERSSTRRVSKGFRIFFWDDVNQRVSLQNLKVNFGMHLTI